MNLHLTRKLSLVVGFIVLKGTVQVAGAEEMLVVLPSTDLLSKMCQPVQKPENFQEGFTEGRTPSPGVGGTYHWQPRHKKIQKTQQFCLPAFASCLWLTCICLAAFPTSFHWHQNTASSVFQHGVKISSSLAILQAFSTRLGLLRDSLMDRAATGLSVPSVLMATFRLSSSYCVSQSMNPIYYIFTLEE